MREMNSAGVRASLSWTEARFIPPLRKCTWESMNPGATIPPRASMMRVDELASARISAFDPTAAIRSPVIATASDHGCDGSAVQTIPLTIAIVTGSCLEVIVVPHP